MRKIVLAAAAVAVSSTFAFAADVPTKMPVKAAPVAVPVDNWTGCYIGANTGYAWANKNLTETEDNGPITPLYVGSATPSGWAYGGQIGCDYQINNNWVVGIRGMWDGSNISGSNQWLPSTFNGLTPVNYSYYNINWFGTVVGKVGYLLNPALELYGLGGVAWVRDNQFWTNTDLTPAEFANGYQTRTGYDVGVGIDWMFAHNWDLFVEYDHMGFGTQFMSIPGIGTYSGEPFGGNVKQSVDKVLVGLNYRFGSWVAPVVAKY